MEGVGSAQSGGRFWSGRSRYLLGAVSISVTCLVMLTPIVLSVAASLKTTQEAAVVPTTQLPSELSLDNYEKSWDYGSGPPRYLAKSVITAVLTIAMTSTSPCLLVMAWPDSRSPARNSSSSSSFWL